jgi:hypothetical protein
MDELLKKLKVYDPGHVFTVGQVAELLNRHRDRVHDYIRKKRLVANLNQTHRAYEIKIEDLRSFVVEDFSKIQHTRSAQPSSSKKEPS